MKYKLIKEFPGSGSIGSIYEINDCVPYEPVAEFFEEIEDEDKNELWMPNSFFIEDDEVKIGSVERIEDGAVFKVGDRVEWDWKYCDEDYIEIYSFELNGGILYFNEAYNFNAVQPRIYEEKEEAPDLPGESIPKYSLDDIKNAQFTLGSLLNSPEDEANVLLIDMDLLQK